MKPDPVIFLAVVCSLIVLLQAASLVVGIWKNLRRQPPIDQELGKLVTREECRACAKSTSDRDGDIFNIIRDFTEKNAAWQRGVERQLGEIHGLLQNHNNNNNAGNGNKKRKQ
jgi:hypothetical protein